MSKTTDAVRMAFHKGYRVNNEGEVINAVGRVRKCQIKRSRGDTRLVFNIALEDKKKYPVPVHKLQAFQKFGEEAFEHDCTRHLDENSLNNRPENIALGSHRDNAMDRQPEARRLHALKASAARGDQRKDWEQIEHDYFMNKLGFKKLGKKYGVSRGALSNRFNKIPGWKPMDLTPDWKAIQAHLAVTGCNYAEISKVFGITVRSCNRKLGPLKRTHQTA